MLVKERTTTKKERKRNRKREGSLQEVKQTQTNSQQTKLANNPTAATSMAEDAETKLQKLRKLGK